MLTLFRLTGLFFSTAFSRVWRDLTEISNRLNSFLSKLISRNASYKIELPYNEKLIDPLSFDDKKEEILKRVFLVFYRIFGDGTFLARQAALNEVYTRTFDPDRRDI